MSTKGAVDKPSDPRELLAYFKGLAQDIEVKGNLGGRSVKNITQKLLELEKAVGDESRIVEGLGERQIKREDIGHFRSIL